VQVEFQWFLHREVRGIVSRESYSNGHVRTQFRIRYIHMTVTIVRLVQMSE